VAGSIAALAMAAALRMVLRIEAEMQQRVVVFARNQDYIAAAATVTTAGAAARHKLLAPEREATVAAITRFYGNDNFVDELQES
jgi:hypothetical protein